MKLKILRFLQPLAFLIIGAFCLNLNAGDAQSSSDKMMLTKHNNLFVFKNQNVASKLSKVEQLLGSKQEFSLLSKEIEKEYSSTKNYLDRNVNVTITDGTVMKDNSDILEDEIYYEKSDGSYYSLPISEIYMERKRSISADGDQVIKVIIDRIKDEAIPVSHHTRQVTEKEVK